jgi:hypothetical protein
VGYYVNAASFHAFTETEQRVLSKTIRRFRSESLEGSNGVLSVKYCGVSQTTFFEDGVGAGVGAGVGEMEDDPPSPPPTLQLTSNTAKRRERSFFINGTSIDGRFTVEKREKKGSVLMIEGYRNATVWTNTYCCKKYHTSGDHADRCTAPPVEGRCYEYRYEYR